jgi:hypothetical protein
MASRGEKGAKEKELWNALRKLGLIATDAVFESRLHDLLTYHEVCRVFLVLLALFL